MKDPQWKRCYRAMLDSQVLSSKWGYDQSPMIVRLTNRCNELLAKGIPVQKIMVYPEDGAHYMSFFFKQEYIDRVKAELS